MEQLKPCPFCGADVDNFDMETRHGGITCLRVRCRCGVQVYVEAGEDFVEAWNGDIIRMDLSAVEKWNRRASDE